jgi:hypothetical protein
MRRPAHLAASWLLDIADYARNAGPVYALSSGLIVRCWGCRSLVILARGFSAPRRSPNHRPSTGFVRSPRMIAISSTVLNIATAPIWRRLMAGWMLRASDGRGLRCAGSGPASSLPNAFAIARGRQNGVFGKRVVLIADVYTTGSTVGAATRALRRAGAADITVLTFARALSEPI